MLHITYASAAIFEVITAPNLKFYTVILGYWLLAFLPALLTTLFLGELSPPKRNATPLINIFSLVCTNSRKLLIFCLLISLMTVMLSGYTILTQTDFIISFGNYYALYYMFIFGIVWLIMVLLGFRPSMEQGNVIKPLFRLIMASLIMLYVVAHAFDFGQVWKVVPILTTVGLSLCFCWYRFRIQFMDVIINQFVRILMALFATVTFLAIFKYTAELPEDLQKLVVFICIILTAVVYQKLSAKFTLIWHPSKKELAFIHSKLPELLAQCRQSNEAITMTEQYLSRLFSADISFAKQVKMPEQVMLIDGEPRLTVQLGYIRGWMPWFSEANYWVKTASLYLQSHLKLLNSLAQEHQQKLNTQALVSLAAKAELSAMRAQIRPHFLFNVLNSIHCFVQTDPKLAEKTIEILSEIMRSVLVMADKDTVELSKEISIAEKYLCIEKIRYTNQFTYHIELDSNCSGIQIPPFSVQPLIENAIKHAVDAQFEPVVIELNVSVENKQLIIEVRDDGPGLGKQNNALGLGLALKNIKSRLLLLYGEDSHLELKNREPKGTIAKINIPLDKGTNTVIKTAAITQRADK